jgi:hypothetical protein
MSKSVVLTKGTALVLLAIFIQPLISKVVLAEKLNGIYWAETGSDDGIEIIGNKYQYLDPTSSSWRKVSELSFIKKELFRFVLTVHIIAQISCLERLIVLIYALAMDGSSSH